MSYDQKYELQQFVFPKGATYNKENDQLLEEQKEQEEQARSPRQQTFWLPLRTRVETLARATNTSLHFVLARSPLYILQTKSFVPRQLFGNGL